MDSITHLWLSKLNPLGSVHIVGHELIVGLESLYKIESPGWTSPLYSPSGNALNPLFVKKVSLYVKLVFVALLILQLVAALLTPTKKITKTYTQIGFPTKFAVISLQALATLGIYVSSHDLNNIVHFATLSLLVLPLQLIAPRKSPVSYGVVLFFWLSTIVLFVVPTIQDTFSTITIYRTSIFSYGCEICVALTSIVLFFLDNAHYHTLIESETDPYNTYNILYYLTFQWVQPLITTAYTGELTKEDVPNTSAHLACEITLKSLSKNWEQEVKATAEKSWFIPEKFRFGPSLVKAIFKSFLYYFAINLSLDLMETTLTFSQPIVLRQLIIYVQEHSSAEDKPPIIIGYGLAILLYAINCTRFFVINQAFKYQYEFQNAVHSSLVAIIHTKSLRLSPDSKKAKPTGDIVNHISIDVGAINGFFSSLSGFVSSPLKLIFCLVSLCRLLGNATWAGMLGFVAVLPFSVVLFIVFANCQKNLMKFMDERANLTNDILTSIKNIKLYSWEKPMLKRLTEIRDSKELNELKKIGVIMAAVQFIWGCVPFLISCSVYTAFTLFYDIPLTADIVFPSLVLFDLLSEPLLELPMLISHYTSAAVSFGRISDFLLLDELDLDNSKSYSHRLSSTSNSIPVKLENVTLLWSTKEGANKKFHDEESQVEETHSNVALSDINITAEAGNLTCIVGKVGSGKTTLIRSILGEIPIHTQPYSDDSEYAPRVEVNGTIAYCPQTPWILNGTVKENILFGYRYNAANYKKAIEACELVSDFQSLADGDKTVVGEKGISLSGGQKARISLARAVYSGADIYLLDDVLSAVDAHVGKKIIDNVLGRNGVLASKTVILATNSVHILHEAHNIYLLKNGTISESGDYDTVVERQSDLAELLEEFGKGKNSQEIETEPEEVAKQAPVNSKQPEIDTLDVEEEIIEYVSESIDPDQIDARGLRRGSLVSFGHEYTDEEDDSPVRKTGNTEEKLGKGQVKRDTLLGYLKAAGYKYIILYLILSTGTYLCSMLDKLVLTSWSEKNSASGGTVNPHFYLALYGIVGISGGGFVLLSSVVLWTCCIVPASSFFHARLAKSVLASPMSFFETTPVGRILNRFTQDIASLDIQIPMVLISFALQLLSAFVTFGVIISVVPTIIFFLVPMSFIYNYIRQLYIPASRDLKRIESASNSPIISTIQESLNGVDTIKAFNQEDRFTHITRDAVDESISVGLIIVGIQRWISIRLQFISSTILFLTTVLALTTLTTSTPMNSSVFGFVMSYAMNTVSVLNAIVRTWAEAETVIVSLERLNEYSELPSEAPMEIADKKPAEGWPEQGTISFNNYSVRYRENLDLVLKDINISINAKEKIGVVGRTGAGKSSLTLALFRIIEAASGNITIDGVNINEIGLFDLRHHLIIIPQDSSTFRASVRENLDPFGEHSDEQLWKVLEAARLKEHVEKMTTEPTEQEKKESKNAEELGTYRGLDAKIAENGSNLSAGQKQLLSLARALLNDTSKILVLDEATAAVDVQTDKIIQQTIRKEFKDKTIVTIAHRLNTIMDSDRVLVLDKGEVKEFDAPDKLKENKDGIFYSLCKEGGYI
ncbi:metal resistance protein YCF1 [Scheffersomyces stipitis CBS 6054]|uniref:Metal resistance protein YCF1 n=1 Tax=Scheffersomyces stipitis (strain ATCC 58785 / CBS 6054 / NBRC 10063 / NRRL Y-11545) TaxID=322104 RepID=A3LWA2_PICST|nr:metal resistance protein YCF1 [Scheffersomyces stipitis CBS 6054]ABN67247.2 metal resistance protein YCF1 [Scheffersomyces stipitis CBS 6054]